MKDSEDITLVFKKPVLGFSAYSGTGKTTLLVKLIPLLRSRGLRIGVIKQTHHDFEIDKPGKDSFELRKAGANQTLLASDKRCALVTEYDEPQEADLVRLIDKLDLTDIDLILVEGFKSLPFAKIELHRPATGNELIFPEDGSVIAVASDEKIETAELPLLDLNAAEEVAVFISHWLESKELPC